MPELIDQGYQYPHEVGAVSTVDLATHFTEHPEMYHPGLHEHIERVLHMGDIATDTVVPEVEAIAIDQHPSPEQGQNIEELPTISKPEEMTMQSSLDSISEALNHDDQLKPFIDRLVSYVAENGQDFESKTKLGSILEKQLPAISKQIEMLLEKGELNVWERAALREGYSAALRELKYSSMSLPGDEIEEPPELIEKRELLRDQYGKLEASLSEDVPGGYSKVAKLMQKYPRLTTAGVNYRHLDDYDRIFNGERNYSETVERLEVEPAAEEVSRVSERLESVKPISRLIILNEPENRKKLFEDIEIIDSFIPDESDKDLQNKVAQNVREIINCGGYGRELLLDDFKAVAQSLEEAGVTKVNVLTFIGNSERLQLISDVQKQEDSEAFELVKILAQTDLFYQREGVYEYDGKNLRDIAISEIGEKPKKYSEYIHLIKPLLEKTKAAGFPIEQITDLLLDRLNPSVISNYNREPGEEFSPELAALEMAEKIGDSLNSLAQLDGKIASRLIDDLIHGSGRFEETENRVLSIKQLGESMQELNDADPELATWVCDMVKISGFFSTVPSLQSYIETANYLRSFPELKEKVFFEDKGSALLFNINLEGPISKAYHSMSKSNEMKGLDGVREYLSKLEILKPTATSGNLSLEQIVELASWLNEVEATNLINIVTSDVYASIRSEEHGLPERVPNSIFSADSMENLMLSKLVKLGGLKETEKLFDTWKTFENRGWFDFSSLADELVEFREAFPDGYSEEREANEQILFKALQRASKMTDKDGFPYESTDSVANVIRYNIKPLKTEDATVLLDWFEGSNMPYSALPTILSARQNAVAEGTADSPEAIFKWVNSPENRETVSRKVLNDYMTLRLGMTSEEIDQAVTETHDIQNNFRVIINAGYDVLAKIATQGGDIKSLFDAGVFEGGSKKLHVGNKNYLLHRSGVEIAMGLRSLDHASDHPVYGTGIFLGNESTKRGARGYGEAVIILDPSKLPQDRITFTPEDSFHGATLLTSEDAMILRHAKDNKGRGGEATSDYIEAQISGGVDLSMVQEIVVFSQEEASKVKETMPESLHSLIVIR
ncbi:MAG: hypothetical protein JWO47_93 [Candidatus Saccharibacteria bacterium]|nr:hypothetical protein [Candidatus Saccharibacteria bacterium]